MEKPLLNRIFSVLVREDECPGDAVSASLMQPNELPKRRRLATLGGGDQNPFMVAGWVERHDEGRGHL
jgi:hypothetical protein